MKALGLQNQHWLGALEKEWARVVGQPVAKHTRPGCIEGERLVVFVDSSVWLNELRRYGMDKMLSNLQERFTSARIKSVVLRLDPD